jgi:ribosomal-protein-alanine acetyltransferase
VAQLCAAAESQPEITMLRLATAADIPAIMNLERQSAAAAHWTAQHYELLFEFAPSPQAASYRAALQHLGLVVQAAGPDALAAQQPNTGLIAAPPILAFLIARRIEAEWELENLVVAEAARRGGLGKRLVNELIARAAATGARAIFLEVRESNAAARSLYHSAGFELSGRRENYYANPHEDAILYRLYLS